VTPVVGRKAELAQLLEARATARAGRGTVVHVRGEAGIGKSRLVQALAERSLPGAGTEETWQCSPNHRSTALYPVVRALESRLAIDRSEPVEAQLAVIADAAATAGLDPGGAVPLLADLLSIRGERATAADLTPLDARTALLRTLEALLVRDPVRHPLWLVVEDLHWADPTTVELLGRIVAGFGDLAVLCVVTFRPEFSPPWTPVRPAVEIDLGPLGAADVRAMASAVSDAALEPYELAWVEAAADGVPLFVEEMVKALDRDSGDGGGAAGPAVPATLEGLITERLDRLPDLGGVIDVAAVLGREVDGTLLGALAPLPAGQLEPALDRLVAEDVLRPAGGAESRYEFSHALLQEAAYTRIARPRRRELHAQVAEVLVRRFGDVAEREPERVAHHWTCAAEPAGAMPYWRAAGVRALERAAYREAAEHFRRGLEALEARDVAANDEADRADMLTHLAASLQAGHGYAAAGVDDAYARARAACVAAGDSDRLVLALRGQWMFHLLRGEYTTALELAVEMHAIGERDGHPLRIVEGHVDRGLVHMYLGNFDRARELLSEAFRRYRPPERYDEVYDAQGDAGVGALAYLALVLWNLGDAEQSRTRSDLSLERAGRIGGPVTRAQAWGMRSILHLSRGDAADLGRWAKRTYAHSADHDLEYWRTVSAMLLGWLEGRAGALAQGTARVEESLDAYIAAGNRLSLPHFYILLADLRVAAGDRPGALALLEAGEEHVAATGERFAESELFRFKARVLAGGDDPDLPAATVAYERSVAVAREQNARMLELRAATRLAAHQLGLGETPPFLGRVAELCDWFGESPDLPDVARARALVASAR
jgi:predicted ATPase